MKRFVFCALAASLILARTVKTEFRRLLKAREPDIPLISRVLCALVAIMLLTGAPTAQAHIPVECAVCVQEL